MPLPSWTEDFMSRVDFMGTWLIQGKRLTLLFSSFIVVFSTIFTFVDLFLLLYYLLPLIFLDFYFSFYFHFSFPPGPRPAYWLSGFFFPQGFMTSVKQTYSRDNRIAVDTLRIGCELTAYDKNDITQPPISGAYVYGLFMEGGRFDREKMCMEESLPRQLLDPVPCVWLKPVISTEYNPVNVYDCPLYKTSIRAGTLSTTGHSTNFVVSLPVPCKGERGQ